MILLAVPAGAAALLLVWGGVEHLREPAILGHRLAGRVPARALAGVEVAVGASVLAALVATPPAGRWALAAQAVLYLGFAADLAVRYARGDRGDCGCSRLASRVGVVGLSRAAALGLLSAAAAAAGTAAGDDPGRLTLAAVAAAVLGVLLYMLPPAMDGLAPAGGGRS